AWGKAQELAAAPAAADAEDISAAVAQSEQAFTAALSDDLNTSEALAVVFGLVSAVNRATPDPASAATAAAAVARFQRVLGTFDQEIVLPRIPSTATVGEPTLTTAPG